MNQSWIIASRISDEYEKGVEEFLQFTKRNGAGVNNKYFCPCVNCLNVRRQEGKGTRGVRVIRKDQQVLQAHLYILNNTDDVLPFLDEHKMLLKSMNPCVNEKWLLKAHNNMFLKWFKEKIGERACDVEDLKWLAREPNFDVIRSGYDINKFSFYTSTEDKKSTMQNSGVTLKAESMHFASSKNNNPVMASTSYYGVIEEIWEVDYVKFRVSGI